MTNKNDLTSMCPLPEGLAEKLWKMGDDRDPRLGTSPIRPFSKYEDYDPHNPEHVKAFDKTQRYEAIIVNSEYEKRLKDLEERVRFLEVWRERTR